MQMAFCWVYDANAAAEDAVESSTLDCIIWQLSCVDGGCGNELIVFIFAGDVGVDIRWVCWSSENHFPINILEIDNILEEFCVTKHPY